MSGGSPVRIERHDDVLVVVADSPPVNALGSAIRQGVFAAVEEALSSRARALVIRCDGRTFFAGADINEFGKPVAGVTLGELLAKIDKLEVPVVAAIHGNALGGGFELALACSHRIATHSAMLGLPEVKLGLIPGAGGTQRLPRAIGLPAALEMIGNGVSVPASRAFEMGLLDRIVPDASLASEAVSFAREVADRRPIPRLSERLVTPDNAAVEAFTTANAKRFKGFEAPAAAIECVAAAAVLPFVEGLKLERQRFVSLVGREQSAAQRHLFFAERQAAKIEDVPANPKIRRVAQVGVIGAGTMGGGIAMNFLSAGIPVVIVETQKEALERGVALIRKNYEASAAKGKLSRERVEAAMSLLSAHLNLDEVADCDLVIEAIYENMEAKKELFAKLDAVVKQGAILASNTSYLDIDEIAAATSRPQDVLGMHFFSPANVMRLLEVVRGERTDREVLATVMKLARTIGKVAVVAGVTYGFIGNRMLIPRQAEATKLLIEGATPDQIDAVHLAFGMPMGPFQMADLAGTDLGWHRDPSRIESIRDALAAEGRWGQKTKAGFYDYDDRRRSSPSPRVAVIIENFRARSGVIPREISDEEIVARTLYPIVNEGYRILEEGKAQRASDIDVVWATGYGWPAYRGGPMFWAEHSEGLRKIVEGLRRYGFEVARNLEEEARASEDTPGVVEGPSEPADQT